MSGFWHGKISQIMNESLIHNSRFDSISIYGVTMIKAIIFDFGRVISAQKPLSLFRSYETDLGLSPGSINPIMFDSQAWQETLVGRMTEEQFWHTIGPKIGLETPEKIEAFRRRYHSDEAINEQVLELIRRLYGRYKLAVLSNSPPDLSRWLSEWNMLDLFDVVFCSGDEGAVKPDPTVFKVTLKRLGIKPEEAVFIDDTIEHVKAARSMGLHAIHFTTDEALIDELEALLMAR
jgi:putative hydrolase of the HAD superfamily